MLYNIHPEVYIKSALIQLIFCDHKVSEL